MDFFDVVRRRRSVRVFQERDVPPGELERVLEVAGEGPSAGNLQAYEVYVVRDKGRRIHLAVAAQDQEFVAAAPVNLVFCADENRSARRYGARGRQLYCLQDATIAAAHAQLAITALGLASCWVGAFDEDEVRRILGLPPHQRPVAIIAAGYPAESPPRPPRRKITDLAHFD